MFGHGAIQGPNKNHKECSRQGPVMQSAVLKPYPHGPGNQKEKSRDRPLSAPSQAAIQNQLPLDSQLKAHPPNPQVPGQVHTPQYGLAPTSIPVVKLVSGLPRSRSHSPRCRVDVDVEPEYQSGWHKWNELRPSVSHEFLRIPSDQEGFDQTAPLSRSFSGNNISSAQPRERNSYSPFSGSSNFLKVPNNGHFYCPPSDMNGKERGVQNPIRGSSSLSNLSVSAPAELLRQEFSNMKLMNSHSMELFPVNSCNFQTPQQGFSPRTSPQNSPVGSPVSPGSWSSSNYSPVLSPESPWPNIAGNRSPPLCATPILLISPFSSPLCSAHGSPFGSQNSITIRSVEC